MAEHILPKTGEFYRDKADGFYQILLTAVNAIDRGSVVVYQELKSPYSVYVMPSELFLSGFLKAEELKSTETQELPEDEPQKSGVREDTTGSSAEDGARTGGIHAGLLEFLDARTYQDKLEVLQGMSNNRNERVLDDIGMSLDISVEDKPPEEKYLIIRNYLKTQIRFEDRRLR